MYKWFMTAVLAAGLLPAQPAENSGSYLGVGVWEIDQARQQLLKVPEAGVVEITQVREGSPAHIAGLKPGDVVLLFNGKRVEGIAQFSQFVRETAAGQKVTLQVYRKGMPVDIAVKIASLQNLPVTGRIVTQQPGGDVPRTVTTWRSPVLGADLEALNGQLAGFFGVASGVLVRAVVAGSSAEKAGLKAGDVIVRVNGIKVATPADVTSPLRATERNTASLVLMRDRKEIVVTVEGGL